MVNDFHNVMTRRSGLPCHGLVENVPSPGTLSSSKHNFRNMVSSHVAGAELPSTSSMSLPSTNTLWKPSHHPSCTCGDCIMHILDKDTYDFSSASQRDEFRESVVAGTECGITKAQHDDQSGVNELDASIPYEQETGHSGETTVEHFEKEIDNDSFDEIYLHAVLFAVMCLVGFSEAKVS
ncbi:hypothetical protein BDU57DRAFT_532990 [Ampelomyces quisqualis]|uniref:Uncharacterized protein n=1 Tax=Ampelomyces quisqualis TaxID=50730 RepID=A0A6A5Q9P2_AMPQU|nr:hypothetical protein BDU57DRAFT_532990 [Ampelomyces quisqualis]